VIQVEVREQEVDAAVTFVWLIGHVADSSSGVQDQLRAVSER
jgi:hypothetical protein